MNHFLAATALLAALVGAPTLGHAHGPASVELAVAPGHFDVHVHSAWCRHDRDRVVRAGYDRVVHRDGGRYALRMVDVWVPAQRVEHYVQQQCRTHGGKHRKVKCKGGYVETHVVPGHYEAREQWVRVDHRPRPRGVIRTRW